MNRKPETKSLDSLGTSCLGFRNREVHSQVPALYIHIPFCKKKCHYCDFTSYAGKEDLVEEYVEALCNEIQSSPPSVPLSIFNGEGETRALAREGVRSIYFGGGTPTLLSPEHFKKILTALTPYNPPLPEGEGDTLSFCPPSPSGRRGWGMRVLEISLEANPSTANLAKLKALRQLGINRLSIGAQSFNNHHLKVLGRIHTAEEIFRIYDDARAVGFENINLDLIFALPDQTLDEWIKDLQTAINLRSEHLSCYCLEGKMAQLDEEQELAMYEHTIETLTAAGFKHYEISNFARPGFECRHNIVYWKNRNYLGIGAGAHSHVDGRRWANPETIEEYLLKNDLVPKGLGPRDRRITIDDAGIVTDKRETIFMGLRLLEGLPTESFKGFEKEVAELIEDGLLMRENNHYKLTRKGLHLGNLVFEKFV